MATFGAYSEIEAERDKIGHGFDPVSSPHWLQTKMLSRMREDFLVGDDGTRLRTCILLLIPPYAIKNHPIFRSLVNRLSEANSVLLLDTQFTLSQHLHC
jgi:hypothetical protein